MRVPFVVNWPGQLPAGKTYDSPVSSLDIFATALALAGVAIPVGKTYDGVDLIPYLTGEKKTSPHDRLFWHTEGGRADAIYARGAGNSSARRARRRSSSILMPTSARPEISRSRSPTLSSVSPGHSTPGTGSSFPRSSSVPVSRMKIGDPPARITG